MTQKNDPFTKIVGNRFNHFIFRSIVLIRQDHILWNKIKSLKKSHDSAVMHFNQIFVYMKIRNYTIFETEKGIIFLIECARMRMRREKKSFTLNKKKLTTEK